MLAQLLIRLDEEKVIGGRKAIPVKEQHEHFREKDKHKTGVAALHTTCAEKPLPPACPLALICAIR
jgi:hypothetical protein